MLKAQVFKDKKGEWRWHMKASNGRIVATSGEGYKRKEACIRGLSSVVHADWTPSIEIL